MKLLNLADLKTCCTFKKPVALKLRQSGQEIKLVEQRNDLTVFWRDRLMLFVDRVIGITDLIIDENLVDQKVLFENELSKIVDVFNDSKFAFFLGKNDDSPSYLLSVVSLQVSETMQIRTHRVFKKEKFSGAAIRQAVANFLCDTLLLLYDDNSVKIIHSGDFMSEKEPMEWMSTIGFSFESVRMTRIDGSSTDFCILYQNETGLYLTSSQKRETFTRDCTGTNLVRAQVLQYHYCHIMNNVVYVERNSEKIIICVMSLSKKTAEARIDIKGVLGSMYRSVDNLLVQYNDVEMKMDQFEKIDRTEKNSLIVIDLQNLYIASKESFDKKSMLMVTGNDQGSFVTVTLQSGKDKKREIQKFESQPLNERIENVLKKSYFELAIDLSKKISVASIQHNIILQAAEYHFQKQEYKKSIEYFIKLLEETNGGTDFIEADPAIVIKRFLDISNYEELLNYLIELKNMENRHLDDHYTNLLIFCFIKLQRHGELKKWIWEIRTQLSERDFGKLIERVIDSCL